LARDAVRSALGEFVTEIDSSCWRVRYDEENFCDLYLSPDADAKKITGFMISGPCTDERLWDALACILKLGYVVLHFEGLVALVGSPSVASHLPEEMIEVFGEPRCISTGSEITDAIAEA
jgi:hypothetical protein